jgi:tetratricopeptide (TPR) repeat protein
MPVRLQLHQRWTILGSLVIGLLGSGCFISWRNQNVSAQAEATLRQVASSTGLPLNGRLTDLPAAKTATVHRGSESYDQAQLQLRATRQALERELIRRPTPDGHRTLGRCYLAEGKSLAAFAHLQMAVQQFPYDPSLHSDLGLALLEVARTSPAAAEEALDAINTALRLAPSLREAQYNRARALEMLGRWDEARLAWQDYIRHDPDSAWGAAARERLEFLSRYSSLPTDNPRQ